MHDYYAVETLVEQLTKELGGLGDPGAERVQQVRVRADVTLSPESLEQAYEMLTQDTPLEGSRLVFAGPPDERWCETCGHRWAATHDDVAGHLLICPSCGTLIPIESKVTIEVLEITSAPAAGAR